MHNPSPLLMVPDIILEIYSSINIKKINFLRLRITEGEEVMLGNKRIDQVDSLTYLGSIISEDIGSSEDINSGIAMIFKLPWVTAWSSLKIFPCETPELKINK